MLPTTSLMDVTQPTVYIQSVWVSSPTTSSIQVNWVIGKDAISNVKHFQVHYQKIASTYVQNGPLLPPSSSGFTIKNLVADTYYKVCVEMFRNDTHTRIKDCVHAMTTNWHIPVSIGSSIGAILALSMIVLIVLVSRCPAVVRWRGKQNKHARKYDSMSSHYHDDHYEFSDTVTHGQDDEFISESEACSYPYELTNHSFRYDPRLPERICNGNRNHLMVQHSFKSPKSRQTNHVPTHHRYHPYSVTQDVANPSQADGYNPDQDQRQDLNHNHQGACQSSELQQQGQQQQKQPQNVDNSNHSVDASHVNSVVNETQRSVTDPVIKTKPNETQYSLTDPVIKTKPMYTVPQMKENEISLPNGYEMKEIKTRENIMEEKPFRKMLETDM